MHGAHSAHTALYSWYTIQILHRRSHQGRLNLSLSLSHSLSRSLYFISLLISTLSPSLPASLFYLPPCLLSLLLCFGQRTGEEAGVCGRLHQSERSLCLRLVLWQDRLQRWEHECECVCVCRRGGGVLGARALSSRQCFQVSTGRSWTRMNGEAEMMMWMADDWGKVCVCVWMCDCALIGPKNGVLPLQVYLSTEFHWECTCFAAFSLECLLWFQCALLTGSVKLKKSG